MKQHPTVSLATRAIRKYLLLSAMTTGILVVGAGGWAATARLSGAVIGPGTIVVEGSVKKIQHLEGGIIKEIRVQDGSRVKAGDVLVRLDDTVIRSGLASILEDMAQLGARRIRLIAERDGANVLPASQNVQSEDKVNAAAYLESERQLFVARRQLLDGQRSQLRQQIQQIDEDRNGIAVKLKANADELYWIGEEIARATQLSEQGLVQFARLSELKRLKAQLDGQRGQMISDDARSSIKASELELQILQLDKDRRAEILDQLLDVDGRMSKLVERRVSAEDQLKRLDIVAPQSGVVHELSVHTIGGVITPGEVLMEVVPTNDKLVIESKIKPTDIDQVHIGQGVGLRFSAFNQRTTREIDGVIEMVSADLTRNQQNGEAWYTARITIPNDERAKLGDLALLAGMPVETFIKTEDRTALSYLVKPLLDQVRRAMQED